VFVVIDSDVFVVKCVVSEHVVVLPSSRTDAEEIDRQEKEQAQTVLFLFSQPLFFVNVIYSH